MKNIKNTLFIIFVVSHFFVFLSAQNSVKETVFYTKDGFLLGGYDVVSYFLDKKAVKGSTKFVYEWNEQKWLFVSSKHLKLFKEDPEKYAPQYGGFCAYAAARGYQAPVDPYAWYVFQDKLYLNYNKSIQRKWLGNKEEEIEKADKFWKKKNLN